MTEAAFHTGLAWVVIGIGAVVFVTLFFVVAPYGRHVRAGWGPVLSTRAGWLIMESPAALAFAAVYLAGEHALSPAPLVLAAMWLAHYGHRSFIYPARLAPGTRHMPLSVMAMAIIFNLVNAYLNARWISHLGAYPVEHLASAPFIAGAGLFVAGMALNLHSDGILIALRRDRPGQGYQIPRGGGFELVSAPNYLGELVEWAGWAVATWSFAGLAFFLFTFANLFPRAIANHRWYRATFPDYPARRRAVIPWLV